MHKHKISVFGRLLLTSVSVAALAAASSALSPARADELKGTFLSLEGGAACGFGDNDAGPSLGPFPLPTGQFTNNRTGLILGNGDCGLTGRIGFGQIDVELLGGLIDYWGIFARHSRVDSERSGANWIGDSTLNGGLYTNYAGPVSGQSDEHRTIIDFEVGRDLDLGVADASVRVFGGVRYARFEANHKVDGRLGGGGYYYGYFYLLDLDTEEKFTGVGPRLGAMFNVPVASNFSFTFGGSASALYGRQSTKTVSTIFNSFSNATTVGLLSRSSKDWVANIEGEAALALQMSEHAQLALGVRAEAWFDQSRGPDGRSRDRHNWGPFVRVTFSTGDP